MTLPGLGKTVCTECARFTKANLHQYVRIRLGCAGYRSHGRGSAWKYARPRRNDADSEHLPPVRGREPGAEIRRKAPAPACTVSVRAMQGPAAGSARATGRRARLTAVSAGPGWAGNRKRGQSCRQLSLHPVQPPRVSPASSHAAARARPSVRGASPGDFPHSHCEPICQFRRSCRKAPGARTSVAVPGRADRSLLGNRGEVRKAGRRGLQESLNVRAVAEAGSREPGSDRNRARHFLFPGSERAAESGRILPGSAGQSRK